MLARLTAAFLLTALMLVSIARADESTFTLDIPAQSLQSALGRLAEQTGLQVVYEANLADGLSSPDVKGKLTLREALRLMLHGTGLDSRFLNDHAIAISSVGSQGRPIAASTPAPRLISLARGGASEPNIFKPKEPPAAKPDADLLDEVLVTGSHIRGAKNVGSPVTVLTHEDLVRTGYTTVQDMLKTVGANTGGGPTEEIQFGLEQQSNFGGGGSVNLRGLGAGSTLVLVNGRRQASGGLSARFTDVSSIPATAIDRIEILTDGASAIYGSDAVGGVVNIILRDDFEGAETQLRYGTAGDGLDETVIGQLVGTSWNTGHAMFDYQYWQRGSLAFADRAFASTTDKRPLGGDDFSLPYSNPGNIADPTTGAPLFGIPAGQDGRSLTPADLLPGVENKGNTVEGMDLIPTQRMHAAFLSASQRVGDRLELYADGRFSQRRITRHNSTSVYPLTVPSSNPFFVDPFGGSSSVLVYYSFIDDLGARPVEGETTTYTGTVGGNLELAAGWQIDITGSYADEHLRWVTNDLMDPVGMALVLADPNPSTAFNPFGDGSNTSPATLDVIRMTQNERTASNLWSATTIAQGPLFSTAGGSIKAAIGADYRSERFHGSTTLTSQSDNSLSDPGTLDRQVSSVFAEVIVPVVGHDNRRSGIEDLHLSLAGRYEKYSDFGTTFNPKLGLSWTPIESLDLRATIGTSFKAPNLTDLDEDSLANPGNAGLLIVPDPGSPAGQSRVLLLSGNNANLHEETATTWTAGVDIHPSAVPALDVSLTYFDIDYEDRIQRGGPANINDIFRAEEQWAPIITRNPSQAVLEDICSRPYLTISQQDCYGVPAIVDARIRNLGVVRVRGLDAKLGYVLPTSLGKWALRLGGSYMFAFDQATTKTSPALDIIDTASGPLSLRLRTQVSWAYQGFGADVAVQHQNSYTDQLSQPRRSIGAMTTVDLHLSYELPTAGTWTDGTQLALSVINAFDREPPFVNSMFGYDQANADPIGQMVSMQLTKRW